MKRRVFWSLLFVVLYINAYTQTAQINSVTACTGDTVLVPIYLNNLSNVGAITLFVEYNNQVITFDTIVNVNGSTPGLIGNGMSNPTRVGIVWNAFFNGVSFTNEKLCDMRFVYLGGSSSLTFHPASEIADYNGFPISTTNTGGTVSQQSYSIDFTGLSSSFCPNDANVTLVGTPSGGSFSGTGISGNNFSPSGLAADDYTVTYTYTDGNCTYTASNTSTIHPLPDVDLGSDIPICDGSSTLIDAGTHNSYMWSTGVSTQSIIATIQGS